jgi:hypothetical protein
MIATQLTLRIAQWPNARDTLERILGAIGDRQLAVSTLLNRIKAGLIQTAAMSCHREERRGFSDPQRTEPEAAVLIAPAHWAAFPRIQTVEELAFWETGDITFVFEERDSFHAVTIKYFGVRFDPKGIAEMIESAGVKKPPPPQTFGGLAIFDPPSPVSTNKGGRPRKDYWDDLWAEICGQIYEGALIPKRQADIEKAMLDWATNHGHELSEAGARQRAQILFNRLKNRG